MVSGRCVFRVSGRKSAKSPATMDREPNMISGRALPKFPPISRSWELQGILLQKIMKSSKKNEGHAISQIMQSIV